MSLSLNAYLYLLGKTENLKIYMNILELFSLLLNLHFPQAKGLGYAMNTAEELKFVQEIAKATGIVLDPVYRFNFNVYQSPPVLLNSLWNINPRTFSKNPMVTLFFLWTCSGKAAYGMMRDMAENPGKWEGRKVLFVHTGGLLGLYDKTEQIAPLVGNWRRMDIHETIPRKEGTGKMF